MSAPKFLEKKPEPRVEQRYFHGKCLVVWVGVVDITEVQGWVQNPRLDLELKKFQDANAAREPDQDEILAIMLANEEFRLKALSEDIRKNGVRTPIIVSSTGTLLDGNRRFFAVKNLISLTAQSDPRLAAYRKIPVIVLDPSCTEDDEELVVVQENFYQDLKLKWSDYVLARKVYEALEAGAAAKTVSQRFQWSTAKVKDTQKIMQLVDEYLSYVTDDSNGPPVMGELEAERFAADSYQYFNEAQKSFFQPLQTDPDFKAQFFDWITGGVFKSFQEVRVAHTAYGNANLRKILNTNDSGAGTQVLAHVNFTKVAAVTQEKSSERISEFVEFLKHMKAQELSELSPESIQELQDIATTVTKMAEAAKNV